MDENSEEDKESNKRTLSIYLNKDDCKTQILREMSKLSKDVYNFSIFCTEIYNKYKNDIYKKLYEGIVKDLYKDKDTFYTELYQIYDHYYNEFIKNKDVLKNNNNIIYEYIVNSIDEPILNDNFYNIENKIIKKLKKHKKITFDNYTKDEFFTSIVRRILKSFYNKNYFRTKSQILNKEKVTIQNNVFINQVKEELYLFKDGYEKISYKKEILQRTDIFKKIEIKKGKVVELNFLLSDQNIISRFIGTHYVNIKKLPRDIVDNIIAKSFRSYSSYFALKKKGIKVNRPKYLGKDEHYILPFFDRSRKDIKVNGQDYVRLTVGENISQNYKSIVEQPNLICLNEEKGNYKKYVEKRYLKKYKIKTKVNKKDNYLTKDGFYINKNSTKIIDGYYLNIIKPKLLENKKISLVEIVPLYKGHQYKINFIYTIDKNKENTGKITKEECLSVDLGMGNLMAIYNPSGKQYLICGKKVIGINEYFNKKIARLQSLRETTEDTLEKEDIGKEIYNTYIKRSNKINGYFDDVVKWFYDMYKTKEKIIIGYNKNWKDGVNLGRNTNRKFNKIPYTKLIHKLKCKFGSVIIIREESYTSKCDALSLEEVCKHEKYLGKRIKRGLFSSDTKKLLNADINGAINIMRKEINLTEISGINLFNPLKIKFNYDHQNKKNFIVSSDKSNSLPKFARRIIS